MVAGRLDFADVAAEALRNADTLVRRWLPGGRRSGREWVALNPTRADSTAGSFKVNLTSGVWSDFATGDRGSDLISLLAYIRDISQVDAAKALADELGRSGGNGGHKASARKASTKQEVEELVASVPEGAPRPPDAHPELGKPTTVYEYQTADGGAVAFYVYRWDGPMGKEIRPLTLWRHGNKALLWQWKAAPTPRPMFLVNDLAVRPDAPVLVVEGEKAASAVRSKALVPDVVAVSWSGGAKATARTDWTPLAGRDVVVWPDNDPEGMTAAHDVVRLALAAGARLARVVELPSGLPAKWDLADPLPAGISIEQIRERVAVCLTGTPAATPTATPRLIALDVADLLAMQVEPREFLLAPWLRKKDLVMAFAPRGVGKTTLACCIAVAVAGGGRLMHWQADKRRKVVYVDAELPLEIMRQRVATAILTTGCDPTGNLLVLPSDLQTGGFRSISEVEGQRDIEAHLDAADLLILDNVSTLCRGGEENAAESWQVVQDWLISLRRSGLAVILLHHAGKNGAQRGTSRREDVLDTIIKLSTPDGYSPQQGARFRVTFEKARSLVGAAVQRFEAALDADPEGRPVWTYRLLGEELAEEVRDLHEAGLTVSAIARKLGKNKGSVSKIVKRLREAV